MVSEYQRAGHHVLFYFAVCIICSLLVSSCVTTPGRKTQLNKNTALYKPASSLYQDALACVNGTKNNPPNYEAAIGKFREFIIQNPRNPRAQEAETWIKVLEKIQTFKKLELETIEK